MSRARIEAAFKQQRELLGLTNELTVPSLFVVAEAMLENRLIAEEDRGIFTEFIVQGARELLSGRIDERFVTSVATATEHLMLGLYELWLVPQGESANPITGVAHGETANTPPTDATAEPSADAAENQEPEAASDQGPSQVTSSRGGSVPAEPAGVHGESTEPPTTG